jgi:hypothetical protein
VRFLKELFVSLGTFFLRKWWMMEFSVTLVFWSCVTLGFFNSVAEVTFQHIRHIPAMQTQIMPKATAYKTRIVKRSAGSGRNEFELLVQKTGPL